MAFQNEIVEKSMQLAKTGMGRVMDSGKSIFNDATAESIASSRGILGTVARAKRGMPVQQAAREAFSQGTAGGGLNWGTVAGSYIGAAAVYRGMSGGGAYRDKNGNTNLVGVPFV